MLLDILSIVWTAACEITFTIWAAVSPELSILMHENVLGYLIVAATSGGLVGLERERAEKPAGLRTNMFICMGSCLFTLASLLSWKYISGESSTADPGRIAAQIVSGVGFLGAGVILKTKIGDIIGITTAATIWLVAAIGMVIGLGFPLLGLLVGATTSASLFCLGRMEFVGWFSSPKEDDSQDVQ